MNTFEAEKITHRSIWGQKPKIGNYRDEYVPLMSCWWARPQAESGLFIGIKCMDNIVKSWISVFTRINNDCKQNFMRKFYQVKDRLELLYWFHLQHTLLQSFWTFPHNLFAHFTPALNWICSIEGTHGKLILRSWFVDIRLHSWQLVLARICRNYVRCCHRYI